MRLINLDDALESIQREIANVACPNTVLYALENRPTVEAIPKEWLLEQSRKLPLTSEKGMYIDEILEDWEEENEQNKENTSQTD